MKRILLMLAMGLVFMVGNAQVTSSDNQPQQRRLIYCSCAYRTHGLPEGEISYSFYALTADIGIDPYVTYCEDRGKEPEKQNFAATEADVEALYNLIEQLEVKSLDGYNATEEMPGATDYRVHVEWADGSKATANWTNHGSNEKAATVYSSLKTKLSAIADRKRKK